MKLSDFLNKVAYIGKSEITDDDGEIYYSNFDRSYITHVEIAKDDGLLKFMAEHEITEELTHGVGFSPKENKWYGWSHRAIFGFGIGSTCKKGDCGYKVKDAKEFIKSLECNELNKDSHSVDVTVDGNLVKVVSTFTGYVEDDSQDKFIGKKTESNYEIGEKGFIIIEPTVSCKGCAFGELTPDDNKAGEYIMTQERKDHSCNFTSDEPQRFTIPFGRGEWTAKTLEDAKLMAIDFKEGVS